MLIHKNYIGKIEVDTDANILYGKVVNIRDIITFQGDSIAEVKQAFIDSVEDYLLLCKEKGKEPNVPRYGISESLDPERRELYRKQREERGFDDTETWGLDYTVAMFVSPRLKRFKELNNGHPDEFTFESWQECIQKMIDAFDEILRQENEPDYFFNYETVDEGLELFGKYFRNLWW